MNEVKTNVKEQERLQDVIDYGILDTSPESELNELAEIASLICNTPISLITIIDKERQWFKAKKGIDLPETARKDAFCQHALHNSKEVLVVEDALIDNRFKDNPYVKGDPKIRFYAGAPLETENGNVLGTLCVLDTAPRQVTEIKKKHYSSWPKRLWITLIPGNSLYSKKIKLKRMQ